jgi:hypothetical protein
MAVGAGLFDDGAHRLVLAVEPEPADAGDR